MNSMEEFRWARNHSLSSEWYFRAFEQPAASLDDAIARTFAHHSDEETSMLDHDHHQSASKRVRPPTAAAQSRAFLPTESRFQPQTRPSPMEVNAHGSAVASVSTARFPLDSAVSTLAHANTNPSAQSSQQLDVQKPRDDPDDVPLPTDSRPSLVAGALLPIGTSTTRSAHRRAPSRGGVFARELLLRQIQTIEEGQPRRAAVLSIDDTTSRRVDAFQK